MILLNLPSENTELSLISELDKVKISFPCSGSEQQIFKYIHKLSERFAMTLTE